MTHEAIYAFLCDGEGLVATGIEGVGLTPLVTHDAELAMTRLSALAKGIARETGKTIRLVKFSQRQELQVFSGKVNK